MERFSKFKSLYVIAVACAFTAIMWTRTYYVRQNNQRDLIVFSGKDRRQMLLSKLGSIDFLEVKRRQRFRFSRPSSGFRLLIVLSAADCSACLDQLPMWRQLLSATQNSTLDGYLIFVDSSESEILQATREYSNCFTVLLDDTNSIKQYVGLPDTPVTIVEDSEMRIRLAEGPTNDLMTLQNFVKTTKDVIRGEMRTNTSAQ